MKLPPPFERLAEHIAVDLPGARAVFTTRRGGFSRGPYATLNLGRLTDDSEDDVDRNRGAIEAELGVKLARIRQVHGSEVARVASIDGSIPEADGQATALRGIGATVLVADCLPIALSAGSAVAMLHAGWRGLASGVIDEGIRAVRELDGMGEISAAIGPGAGGCCYEVGEEVLQVFDEPGPNLDLKTIARAQLERAGVGAVHDVGLCTICADPELFFSHRRDAGVTGRQAGIVWLT